MAPARGASSAADGSGGSGAEQPKKEANPNQLHPTFPIYQRWVIDKLVGLFANDPPNVVLHIVSRWIDQNEDYLKSREISFAEWRKSLRPQGVVGVKSLHEHMLEAPPPKEDSDGDDQG
jgi:hypothetical protein